MGGRRFVLKPYEVLNVAARFMDVPRRVVRIEGAVADDGAVAAHEVQVRVRGGDRRTSRHRGKTGNDDGQAGGQSKEAHGLSAQSM